MAQPKAMKTKKNEIRPQSVSKIIRTTSKDGNGVIGFTVYCGSDSFYNVMRCFRAEDYDQVYNTLEKQRRQIIRKTPKTKEKK